MNWKSKIAVLSVKKNHCSLQYRDSPVFINEHLSPNNCRLFTAASQIKLDLNFKFLWTKNGSVYLRKNDVSEIIEVTDDEVLSLLRASHDNIVQSPITGQTECTSYL